MRRVCLGMGMLLASGLLLWQLQRGGARLPLFDFVEYWAAGRLNAEGHNPYDPEAVHELERATGRTDPGVLMWNPPWSLPFVMPFGLIEVHTAHLIWLLLQFAVLVVSADVLWRLEGGEPARRWVAWLCAFTFLPALFALTAGQISPLLLLGAVAFLRAESARLPVVAGMATLLLAIKPHLVLLFFAALVLDEVHRRRWRLLASGALTGVVATLVALAFNPDIVGQYWRTLTTRPPAQYHSPTLGTVLRLWLGKERFWLQFLPPLAGLAWLGWYWRRHRRDWDWGRHLSPVLFASLLTAPYGAWPFDLVLLLVPVVEVAVRSPRRQAALAAYVVINALALAQILARAEYFFFLWMTPALLTAYLVLRPRNGGIGGGSREASPADPQLLTAPAEQPQVPDADH